MAPGLSWEAEPERVERRWHAFRQVDPNWTALYRSAGERHPTQESGRWHRRGEGYAQYFSLDPHGAWAEFIRYEEIRDDGRRTEARRNLWRVTVTESDIADLSTFDAFAASGLDPALAVGDHKDSQGLADDLRNAGYRGVLAPSAALPGATNLTVFGERYEREITVGDDFPGNPDPSLWYPVLLLAGGAHPPRESLTQACYAGEPHIGLEVWELEQET